MSSTDLVVEMGPEEVVQRLHAGATARGPFGGSGLRSPLDLRQIDLILLTHGKKIGGEHQATLDYIGGRPIKVDLVWTENASGQRLAPTMIRRVDLYERDNGPIEEALTRPFPGR